MKKIVYNKLIRDNIPDIIESAGKTCNIKVLSDNEYIDELNRKMLEEITEYQEEYDIMELADLEELIQAIVIAKGYSLEKFNELRVNKRNKNGGFDKKLFLIDVIEE